MLIGSHSPAASPRPTIWRSRTTFFTAANLLYVRRYCSCLDTSNLDSRLSEGREYRFQAKPHLHKPASIPALAEEACRSIAYSCGSKVHIHSLFRLCVPFLLLALTIKVDLTTDFVPDVSTSARKRHSALPYAILKHTYLLA